MSFIPTLQKVEIAVSEVVKAEPGGANSEHVFLTLRSGDQYTTWRHHWTEATQPGVKAVFPSPTGYNVVEMMDDEDPGAPQIIHFEPIIGWAVRTTGQLIPVTAVGIDEDAIAVLVPDGRVCYPNGGWCPSLDAWRGQQ